jgi:endonuclease IV
MSLGVFISKNSHILDKKYKKYIEAVKYEAELLDLSALCIFMIGPMNKNKISMDHQGIKAYCEENNIEIWPHGSYTSVGIWNVNHDNRHENKSKEMIRNIKDHLVIGKQLGAKGISFHLGRKTIEETIETMEVISDCKEINSVRRNPGELPYFLIEFIATKSNDSLTYESSERLNSLVSTMISNPKITIKWAINIDTAHQFAGGVSYGEHNSWNNWIAGLSKEAKENIKLIHLNGASAKNFDTGKDYHEIPLSKTDAIWGHLISHDFRNYMNTLEDKEVLNNSSLNFYEKMTLDEKKILHNSSLNEIVQWCKQNNIAMIMEIKKDRGGFKEIKMAVDIVNGLLKHK